MKISIAAIGRLKKGPESELFTRYFQRVKSSGRGIGITSIDVREFPESAAQSAALRKQGEAEHLLSVGQPQSTYIALDENGKDLNSHEFSDVLGELRDNGNPHLIFAIGGPDGLDKSFLEKSTLALRLGKLTWPHQLARVLLMEQIYRAVTILGGHPYHRR